MKSFSMLLGRWFISAVFIVSAALKIIDWDATSAYMASKGFTLIPLFQASAAALEFVGGLALTVGLRTRFAALLLALFLIPTTIIFHDFWMLNGPAKAEQMTHFLKNSAIFGGLLYIVANGAGSLSVDSRRKRKQAAQIEE
jgi:putative oxidoreductase